MPLIFAQFKSLAKPLAFVSKFSARQPIHVILITVFLSAVAYLSVVRSYFNGWQLDTKSIFAANTDVVQLQDECVHYFHAGGSESWTELSNEEFTSAAFSEHYYLMELDFKSQNRTLVLPELENAVVEKNNSKFILQEDLTLPKQLSAADGTIWVLRPHRFRLYDLKDGLLSTVHKLIEKIQDAELFDVFIIGTAYFAMLYTIVGLFLEMRKKTDSKFWIALSAIVSSTSAFCLALYTSQIVLQRKVTALSLIEGLPFVVVIVGFNHKIRLAAYLVNYLKRYGFSQKCDASELVFLAMSEEGGRLLQDHLLCIIAFVGCSFYAHDLEALTNFCILASLVLVYDLILTCTYYASVLALKLEINIIHRSTIIKETLEEDGIIKSTAESVSFAETKSKASFNPHF